MHRLGISTIGTALAVLCAALSSGCGGDEPSGPEPSEGPELGFVFDAPATGARIWIDARLQGDVDAVVEVWGAELGPVFGYSVHVEHDAEHLSVDSAQAPSASPTIGADPAEAVYAATAASGDVAIGGVRRSPTLGEIEITAPTLLGDARLHAGQARTSKLWLDRVVVRRADGGYVPVQTAGGQLTTAGAP